MTYQLTISTSETWRATCAMPAASEPIAVNTAQLVALSACACLDLCHLVGAYCPNLWPTTVQKDLPRMSDHIKAAWDNRTTAQNYMQILTGRGGKRQSRENGVTETRMGRTNP